MDWNLCLIGDTGILCVVPYIGTWIETNCLNDLSLLGLSRTLYRYVDWNQVNSKNTLPFLCRTLYRYVDWNKRLIVHTVSFYRRTLYRYVDWNLLMQSVVCRLYVVPYIGTWIETLVRPIITYGIASRTLYRYVDWNPVISMKWTRRKGVVPYIGTWIETRNVRHFLRSTRSRTLYRYVDWNLEKILK